MLPVDFKHRNLVLGKPQSMTDEECMSLPVWFDGKGRFISKWVLNKEERELIAKTGEIYFSIASCAHPPIEPMVESPFDESLETAKPSDRVRATIRLPKEQTAEVEGTIQDRNGLIVLVTDEDKIEVPFYACIEAYFI
jgi:hypothetical protein